MAMHCIGKAGALPAMGPFSNVSLTLGRGLCRQTWR